MARVVFVGAYAYAAQVLEALPEDPVAIVTSFDSSQPRWQRIRKAGVPVHGSAVLGQVLDAYSPDLVVVAGWRKLVPIVAPTVGFHSAKLPEYPGRAPVANAILRGDKTLTNTMLWLDDGIDTGDIIDTSTFPIQRDPDAIYHRIGRTSAEMLRHHWKGLLRGPVAYPGEPQDMSKRGPLTPADAWQHIAPVPEWVEAFG